MNAYILDTNGILRYLVNDIPAQAEEVEALLKSVQKREATITIFPLVILEAIFVLWKLYKQEKKNITKQMMAIVDNPILDVRERLPMRSALAGWSAGAISFVDAYLLFQSKTEAKTLFTFDRKLKRLAQRS